MSRQWIWPALGLTAVLLPLCLWVFPGSRSEPEWTGRSPEALEELKAGFDDLARQYWSDAVAHFERALELDPEMPIAKLELAQLYAVDDSERERLWQELDNMSIDDAKGILNGPDDAATQYFRRETSADLKGAMRPIVDDSLADVGAVRAYDDMMGEYDSIPFVPDVKADLTDYALDGTLDGLFVYVAREEAAIRNDPLKRSTELLQTVFG